MPAPFLREKTDRASELTAVEINLVIADPARMRLVGRLRNHPCPCFSLCERLIGKGGVPPDAAIDRKDTALAHCTVAPYRSDAMIAAISPLIAQRRASQSA